MGKRLAAFMLVMVNSFYLFLASPVTVQAAVPVGYREIAGNGRFTLYYENAMASVAVEDKSTGQIWTSIPPDWKEDKTAKGINQTNLVSAIVLETYDENKQPVMFNSYAFSIRKKSYTSEKIKDGIRVSYDFKEKGIQVSIEYVITDKGLSVKVPSGSIKEEGKYLVSQIRILPFLGAGRKSDDGYIFIPDGSGAVIRFDDHAGNVREVSKTVYGWDRSIPITELPLKEEVYRMPVFGIRKNATAVFGIIESGDCNVNINSGVAGDNSQYFRVYPSFVYRDIHNVVLFEGDSRERFVVKLSPNHQMDDLTVLYFFLTGDNADYSGMAGVYRDHLIEKKLLVDRVGEGINFHLTLLGAVRKRKIFLGIPFDRLEPLTTFRQAQQILDELKSRGVTDISLRYNGINKGGFHQQWDSSITPERKLGGERGLKKLVQYVKDNRIDLYLNAELLEVYKTGRGFSSSRDAARFISNASAMQWKWSPINKRKEKGIRGWYILSPTRMLDAVGSFMKSFGKHGLEYLSLDTIGDTIYSEYRTDRMISRDQAGEIWDAALNKAAQEIKGLMVTGGNAYTFPYASVIIDAPVDYSGFDMETEPVPFYQMVIHGFITYTGTASNLRYETREEFLRTVEYGGLPRYEWMYRESSVMKETQFNYLYSGCYKDWIEDAVREYGEIKALYKDIHDKRMVRHEKLAEGVYRTTYENGVSIIVNYSDKAYSSSKGLIGAKGYSLQRGESK
jgi:hypothetical protein